MNTIKVNPDELLANAKKIEKCRKNYEKDYKDLVAVLESNQAQMDELTHGALMESVKKVESQFNAMSLLLSERSKLIGLVAKSYKDVNETGVATAIVDAAKIVNQIIGSSETTHSSGGGAHV